MWLLNYFRGKIISLEMWGYIISSGLAISIAWSYYMYKKFDSVKN